MLRSGRTALLPDEFHRSPKEPDAGYTIARLICSISHIAPCSSRGVRSGACWVVWWQGVSLFPCGCRNLRYGYKPVQPVSGQIGSKAPSGSRAIVVHDVALPGASGPDGLIQLLQVVGEPLLQTGMVLDPCSKFGDFVVTPV